jgi:hypothetical protein
MTISRRGFIKGLAAAPFAIGALDLLFKIPKAKAIPAGELGLYENVTIYSNQRPIMRHAISLGHDRQITTEDIRKTKRALRDWVKDHAGTTDPYRVRFSYALDDFGNEVGIGASVYEKRTNQGMFWYEVEDAVLREIS